MKPETLKTACSLFLDCAKTDPFNTWLIVETEEVRRRAFEILNTPVLQTRITTIRTLAQTILKEQNTNIRIIPEEEQYLLFSTLTKDAFGKTETAKNLTETTIDLYVMLTQNAVECPTDTEKGKKAAEVFSRYQNWCEEHHAADADTAVKIAAGYAEHMNPNTVICFGLKSTTPAAESLLYAFKKEPIRLEAELTEPEESKILVYKNTRDEIAQTLEAVCTLEENGIPGSDILVLSPALPSTLPLIEEIAAGFFVNRTTKLTFKTAERKSIQTIPAVRSVLAFVSAAYKAEETDIAAILECPAFSLNRRRITAGTLRKAVKMTGSTNWRTLQDKLIPLRTRDWQKAEDEKLQTVLNDILDRAEGRQKNARTLREKIEALRADLDDLGWTYADMTETENAARKAFFGLLERLESSAAADSRCSPSDFSAILSRGCRKNAGIRYPENETAFRLGKLRSAAGIKTQYVFIIGLNAKNIPKISATLPLLTIQETKTLLPDRYRKAAENIAYFFKAACSSAEKQLTVSYAESDGTNSHAPSPFLTRIGEPEAAKTENPKHSITGCQKSAGKAIAEQTKTDSVFGIRNINDTAYRITAAEPKPVFEKERFSAVYEEKKTFSPSFLEEYAECPVSWYFKYHLRLENPEDFSAERIKIGTVMHKVFERFFTVHDCITEETADAAYEELARLTCEEMEKTGIKTPAWKALELGYLGCGGVQSALSRIIAEETAYAREGYRTSPEWIEREVEGEMAGVCIAGRADRVLQKEDGCFKVLDYKTGTIKKKTGTPLQLPIYSRAVQQMTGKTPTVGRYLPIGVKKQEEYNDFLKTGEEHIKQAEETVQSILEKIKSGSCTYPKNCKDYCPFEHICRRAEGGDDA